ncbi:MAG: patatin-like phospholipase family protein [Deltaproteobacteria bacterium]|nr:patatin-like phospholipase family protein [Deltaproteobacteria bacterium]
MKHDGLLHRLKEPGPKRILALDGGGIRGLVSIGYLARIERLLRRRYRKPDLVLSDYFDLVGGTSTGAILATLLALGQSAEEIREMYLTLGREAFRPRKNWFGPLGRVIGAKFDEKPLEDLLKEHLGQRKLDSADVKVGLVIIIKRADTGSVWVVLNVPGHRFYEMNRKMLLWEIVRSSTAAPIFFRPKFFADVGEGEEAVFVDGAVSMHNNPALQLLMVATLQGYAIRWPLGENKLFLCSIGTGSYTRLAGKDALKKFSNLHWLAMLATQLMKDSCELNETILQWISMSPTARDIDRQIGSLSEDHFAGKPLVSYLRYNIELEQASLEQIGLRYNARAVEKLKNMSEVKNISELDRIGSVAAEKQVFEEHFPRVFDRSVGN